MARKKRKTRKRKKKSSLKRIFQMIKRRFRKFRYWVIGCLAVLLMFYVSGKLYKHIENNRLTINSTDYNGIDVSKYQGKINWTKVAADSKIQFVYVKASEGATRVDSRYSENFKGAKSAGIKVGSYHYFIGRKSAKEQFDNFRRNVSKRDQDLIPMVDVEEAGNKLIGRKQLQQNLSEFMQLVKDEYGCYPLLYSQLGFYNEKLAPEFNRYFIFMARYSTKEPRLKGGGKYNIWQYTEKGHVKGISGTVDLDRFANGTSLSDIEM